MKTTKTELVKESKSAYLYGGNRLRYCRAMVYEDCIIELKNGYYSVDILKSYNTIVAVRFHRNNTVYQFDFYSATTCQHINKFADEYGAKVVKLYVHSRMNKSDANYCLYNDFSNLINLD